jgi:general secretion pathway protein B
MSYILEALQKSEKKRRREEIPALGTVFMPGQDDPVGKTASAAKRYRMFMVFALSFVLVGGLVWWGILPGVRLDSVSLRQELVSLLQNTTDSAPPQPAQVQAPPRQAQAPSPAVPEPAAPSPAANPQAGMHQQPAPLLVEGENLPVIERKFSDIPVSANLPPPAREAIRSMKFAGHVYSENPRLRMIIINDKILHENDAIDADFRLGEITRSGVVLLYNSQRLAINIF